MTKKTTPADQTEVQTSAQPDATHLDGLIESLIGDQYAGQGGSYVYDPETQTRTRAE